MIDLDEQLAFCDLSTRCYNALRRADIVTVGQLAGKSAGNLLDLRGFGVGHLTEVVALLQANGLDLQPEPHFENASSGCCGNMHSARCGDCPLGVS